MLLPGEEGLVKLTGVTGTVPALRMRRRNPPNTANPRIATALELLGDGATVAEINQRLGWHSENATRVRLDEALTDVPAPLRAALYRHPVRSVRATLWQLHTRQDDDALDGYRQRLAAVYLTDGGPSYTFVPGASVAERQKVLDALAASNGPVRLCDLEALVSHRRRPREALRHMAATRTGDPWPAILALEDTVASDSDEKPTFLTLLSCPACGGSATKAVRLPEVTGVLCRACGQSPNLPDVGLPHSYLELDQTARPERPRPARPNPARFQGRQRAVTELARWHTGETFTIKQLGEAAGCSQNLVRDLVLIGQRDEWLVQHSAHQQSTGSGMIPTRYRLIARPPDPDSPSIQPTGRAASRAQMICALPDEPFTAQELRHTTRCDETELYPLLKELRSDGTLRMLDTQVRHARYQITEIGQQRRAAAHTANPGASAAPKRSGGQP